MMAYFACLCGKEFLFLLPNVAFFKKQNHTYSFEGILHVSEMLRVEKQSTKAYNILRFITTFGVQWANSNLQRTSS